MVEPIFAVILCVVLVAVGYYWMFTRSEAIIQQWAQDRGYKLLHSEYRMFRTGPFFMLGNRNQTVYYITVEDQAGTTHRGWARCGGWLMGLLSDEIEVLWDD